MGFNAPKGGNAVLTICSTDFVSGRITEGFNAPKGGNAVLTYTWNVRNLKIDDYSFQCPEGR